MAIESMLTLLKYAILKGLAWLADWLLARLREKALSWAVERFLREQSYA